VNGTRAGIRARGSIVARSVRTSSVLVLAVWMSFGVGVVVAAPAGATVSTDLARAQFIKDEVTEYNAIGTFIGQIERLKKSSTDAQVRAVAEPLGRSIEAFRMTVKQQSWPKKEKSQTRELGTVATATIEDLETSPTNTSTWRSATIVSINDFVEEILNMDTDLGLPPFKDSQFVDACQADGATVDTAMAAFHAQHPSVVPTKALLTGKKDGGPYLENWPHNAPHYTFTLTASGRLFLSAPSAVKSVLYRGPNDCYPSFQ
jgi:hypothetical protein